LSTPYNEHRTTGKNKYKMTKRGRKNICVLIAKRLISKSKIKVNYKVIFQAMLLGKGFQEKIR
jgi:hypothetical protein